MSNGNASTSTKLFSASEMEEAYSKVHDEGACVTWKGLMVDMGIRRETACAILEELPYHRVSSGERTVYEVVRYRLVADANGTSVMRLVKSRLSVPSANTALDNDTNGTICSIALVQNSSCPSVQSAHQITMATLRDLTIQGSSCAPLLDPLMLCDEISPAAEFGNLTILDAQSSRAARIDASFRRNNKHDNKPVLTAPSARARQQAAQLGTNNNTPTTAASFFGDIKKKMDADHNSKTNTPATGARTNLSTPDTIESKDVNIDLEADIAPSNEKLDDSSLRSISDEEANDETDCNRRDKIHKKEEDNKTLGETMDSHKKAITTKLSKRQLANKKHSFSRGSDEKIVGNADDFQGDSDEDDEFLKEDAMRKKRNAVEARKTVRDQANNKQRTQALLSKNRRGNVKRSPQDDDNEDPVAENDTSNKLSREDMEEEDEEEKTVVRGAMDAFTISKPKTDNEPANKKRILTMEEKTFVDENGYFRTEMVKVWKDVDEEEERKAATVSNNEGDKSGSSKEARKLGGVKSTKHMKQAGLMGFFAKRK